MAIIKVVNVKRTPLKNLKYIANDEKTLNGTLITGINCSNDIYKANEKMENINRNYGKKNEVKLKHIIHSFHKDDNLTPHMAHLISMEWYEKMFPDNKCIGVIATHDGDPTAKNSGDRCIHTHISINAIDIEGKRIDIDKKWLEKAVKISNEICKSHGLTKSIVDFRSNAKIRKTLTEIKMQEEGKVTFKGLVKKDLDGLLVEVKSYDELLEKLKEMGYEVKDGKELSIKNESYGMIRNIRTKTLGSLYNKENLINRIKENNKLKIIKVKGKEKSNYKWIPREEYKLIHSRASLANIIKLAIMLLRKARDNGQVIHKRRNNVEVLNEINKLSRALDIIQDNRLINLESCNRELLNISLENNKLNRLYGVNFGWPWVSHLCFSFIPTVIMTHFGAQAVTALRNALPMDGIPMKTLFTVGAMLPCVGIAILLRQIVNTNVDFIPFLVGFTLAASLHLNLVSITVISLLFAMIFYEIEMFSAKNSGNGGAATATASDDDDEEEEDI